MSKKDVKSKKDNSGGVHIHLTNRWLYSLIFLVVVLIAGVGVYALGAVPNPGHAISELQTCSNGQILETSGGAWSCVGMPSPGVSAPPTCTGNNKLVYNGGWSCTSETDPQLSNWLNSRPNFYPYNIQATGGISASGGFGLGVNSVVSWGDYSSNAGYKSGTSCTAYYSLAACYSSSNYHGVCACISQGSNAGTWKFVA